MTTGGKNPRSGGRQEPSEGPKTQSGVSIPDAEIQRFMDRFQQARGQAHKTVILPHVCDPGWKWTPFPDGHVFGGLSGKGGMYGTPPSPREFPKGTVWRCNCGQHWVSRGRDARDWPGLMSWRRESRRERRKRLGLRWWQRSKP